MDINIKGDPGTGNSFTEIIVKEGAIYQPNGTTNITNNYFNGIKSEICFIYNFSLDIYNNSKNTKKLT